MATPPSAHCTPGYAVVHPFDNETSKHAANWFVAWLVSVTRTDALPGQRASTVSSEAALQARDFVGYARQTECARLEIEDAGLSEAELRQRAQGALSGVRVRRVDAVRTKRTEQTLNVSSSA